MADKIAIPKAVRDVWAAYEGNAAFNLDDAVAIKRQKGWCALLFAEGDAYVAIAFTIAVDLSKAACDRSRYYWDVLNDRYGPFESVKQFKKDPRASPGFE